MAREPKMYRFNLERVLQQFTGGEAIPVKQAGEWLGIDERSLKEDRTFPMKKVGGRYYISAAALAMYMSE